MKLSLWTASIVLLFNTCAAWEVDPRCRNRRLQEGAMFEEEEEALEAMMEDNTFIANTTSSLRGRELQTTSSPFQLKMYWQQGYCWQEEWIERKYCLSCIGTCTSGATLHLQTCDSTKDIQRFIYRAVANTGGGQLRTARSSLCLERTNTAVYQLRPCLRTNQASQIFNNIRTDGVRFEWKPYNSPDQCIVNNNHHPKPNERLYSTTCGSARMSRTSFWMAIPSTTSPLPPVTQTPATKQPTRALTPSPAVIRPLTDRSIECSDTQPCMRCQGDCDKDSDCLGNFLCFQRWTTEAVPGCSGTGISGKDYCY